LAEIYDVTIELKFGKQYRAIVENEDEIVTIKQGHDINLVDEIVESCKAMANRRHVKMVNISRQLESFNNKYTPLPNNLYDTNKVFED